VQPRVKRPEAKADLQGWESYDRRQERILPLTKDWTNSPLLEFPKESPQQPANPGPLLPSPPDLLNNSIEETIQRLFPTSAVRQAFAHAILTTLKTQRKQRTELCAWIDQWRKVDLPKEWMTAGDDLSFELAYRDKELQIH